LENTLVDKLPELPDDVAARLAEVLKPFGFVPEPVRTIVGGDGDSLWRDINDTALLNLDAWVPALGLPDTKRNHNGYRAVAAWRGVENANLSFHRDGIKDWGTDKSYTPIDVVMAALGVDVSGATNWLRERLGIEEPKDGFDMAAFVKQAKPAEPVDAKPANDNAPRRFKEDRSTGAIAANIIIDEWKKQKLSAYETAYYIGQLAKTGFLKRDHAQGEYVEKRMSMAAHYTPDDAPECLIAFEEGLKDQQQEQTRDYIIQAAKNPKRGRGVNLLTVTQNTVAEQFTDLNKGKLLFCHSQGAWFEWDDAIWQQNETRKAFNLVRVLSCDLSNGQSSKDKKTIQSSGFATGVEKFVQANPVFARAASDWDKDLWKLGTPNGTIDLRTGKLMSATPDDMITKTTAVAPADAVSCPLWLQFLAEATGGDAEMTRFLQQWCGYCLTGVTREHALVFMYGPGGNGKSVFLNTVLKILAGYACSAAMETFTASKNDKHPTDLAMLRGARLVTASETEQGKAWAESRIKQITGGDPITARFMRQNFFTYMPQFKLTIIGNHRPVLRNVDDAMRRRFNIVPFTRKPPRVDKQLDDKLSFEWPGILRWMIEGCLDWQKNGLVRPASIEAATEAYFSEQDLFGQWLEDYCDMEPENQSMWDTAATLFASWKEYVKAAGEEPGSARAFAGELQKRGFTRKRTHSGRGFSGLRVKHGMEPKA
jgi:putative DNA primase/helicase